MARSPLPARVPVRPKVVAAATSMALGCVNRMLRAVSKLAVVASTPPLKVTPPVAAPRLASLDTDSVPTRKSVPPV
ncbi:hypothetical protein D3C72_2485500 [compost metagenome]